MSARTRSHPTPVLAIVAVAGLVSCSLRSLDYLSGGEEAPIVTGGASSSGGTTQGGTSGAGGLPMGGADGGGGSPARGGQGGSTSEGGSAGASTGGTAGEGGTSQEGGTAGQGGTPAQGGTAQEGGTAGDTGGGSGGTGAGCTDCVLEDETPYQLVPSHNPESCVDVRAFSVNEGTRVQQYRNHSQVNQVFWAQDRGDGSFSFRSAHSGKCLEVSGASTNAGAAVRQWRCTGEAHQRWRAEPAGDGLFRLIATHSGLGLDVAGAAPLSDGELVVQNPPADLGDSFWQLRRATQGAFVALREAEDSDRRARHVDQEMRVDTSVGADAEWKVVSGLADAACVSFEARDRPGSFLRQEDGALSLEPFEASALYALETTFCFRTGLEDLGWSYVSIESLGEAQSYVARDGDRIVLAEFQDTAEFRTRATWYVRAP